MGHIYGTWVIAVYTLGANDKSHETITKYIYLYSPQKYTIKLLLQVRTHFE